jgi:hypothetical protein
MVAAEGVVPAAMAVVLRASRGLGMTGIVGIVAGSIVDDWKRTMTVDKVEGCEVIISPCAQEPVRRLRRMVFLRWAMFAICIKVVFLEGFPLWGSSSTDTV